MSALSVTIVFENKYERLCSTRCARTQCSMAKDNDKTSAPDVRWTTSLCILADAESYTAHGKRYPSVVVTQPPGLVLIKLGQCILLSSEHYFRAARRHKKKKREREKKRGKRYKGEKKVPIVLMPRKRNSG